MAAGADTLVFPIDTFGGRVDSALRIASLIGSVEDQRTIAFVGLGGDNLGVSWSAGALIALSTREIYMAPGTSLGAAAPVLAAPDGTAGDAGEKTVSAVRAQMAALAEKNGHPQSLALAMVDYDVEVIELLVDGKSIPMLREDATLLLERDPDGGTLGRTISAKGKLLSLTAGEALRYGLSTATVGNLGELAALLNRENSFVFLNPNMADDLVVLLTSPGFQSILILAGLVALFLEINSPGFGIPGSIALIAFAVLFGSNMLMGTLGSLEIILFILGVGLLVVEIFVLPGFGIAGITGLGSISLALILSMQDFILPENQWQWDIFSQNALTVASGVVLGILTIGLLIAFGPKIHLFDRLTLKTAITGTATQDLPPGDSTVPNTSATSSQVKKKEKIPGQSANPESTDVQAAVPWDYTPKIGDKGIAQTVLRPSGRGTFSGHTVSVEAEGGFVPQGTSIRVTMLKGGVVYVSPGKTKRQDS